MSDAPASQHTREIAPADSLPAGLENGAHQDAETAAAASTPAPDVAVDGEPLPPSSDDTLVQSAASEETEAALWLTRRDRLFIGMLALAALLLMCAHWARLSGWGLQEVEIDRHPARQFEYKIDINTATWVEWSQLDGIGETLARRIVEDRDQHGPFIDVDDIQRVKGIGPKKLDAIRPWLKLESPHPAP